MKINKFLALALVAVMAIGAMGFVSAKVHAQSGTQPAPQAQVTEALDNEQVTGPDTDNIEEQVGEQIEDGIDDGNEAAETEGSDSLDEVPSGTPAITADEALLAAQSYLNTTASGTATLDDENGILVFSVDLNSSDVKVDAMSGEVLGVDQVGDGQFEGGN